MSSASHLQKLAAQFGRQMASSAGSGIGRKVAVLGAAGGIGQSLSMLMKVHALCRRSVFSGCVCTPALHGSIYHLTLIALPTRHCPPARTQQMNQQVSQLSLYDIAGTPGVGADVSHINTRAQVKVGELKALLLKAGSRHVYNLKRL